MAHTYRYSVLSVVPNPIRGERVNVGVVVFNGSDADVRFLHGTKKLKAITGHDWTRRLNDAQKKLAAVYCEVGDAEKTLREFDLWESAILPSEFGWLDANDADEYEARVKEVLNSLVALPKLEREKGGTRINTEIAGDLKKAKVMAKQGEGIESGRVIRNYVVDESENLEADFAIQNGHLHIASTLDLRRKSVPMADAALKSIVLDKASRIFGKDTIRIGVFAADKSTVRENKSRIDLLGDYSEYLFDWEVAAQRKKFKQKILDAYSHAKGGLL